MSQEEARATILAALRQVPSATICTTAGDSVRARMMHIGVDDDLTLYVASLKGDPKVLQISHHPDVAVLAHFNPGDETQSSETEVTAKAVLVHDPRERERGFALVARNSPIVAHFTAEGALDRLDLIKLVPRVIKHRVFYQIVQGFPPLVLTFPQNEAVVSDWSVVRRQFWAWVASIRVFSLTAALVPVVFATAYAWYATGRFSLPVFIACLVGGLSLQAGSNILNDYGDYKSGTDNANRTYVRPFTGGSRVIQLGLLSPVAVLTWGLGFVALAGVAALYLVAVSGPQLLWVLFFGFLTGPLYSDKVRGLVRFGLGEIVIGLDFGVLMIAGTYFAQTGRYDWAPILAGLPITLLIMAVIYINEFADREADALTGKHTWAVRLGLKRAGQWFGLFYLGTFGFLVLAIQWGYLPPAAYAALVALPFSLQAVVTAYTRYDRPFDLIPANAGTALSHLAVGGALSWSLLLDRLGLSPLPTLFAAGVVAFLAYMWYFIQRQVRLTEGLKKRFSGEAAA